jgi:calcineurin-like phosphoesterase family protein
MEDIYLIEIRLGTTKWRVKETIFAIARYFRIEHFVEKHPHVTLFGPFTINDGIRAEQILEVIARVASRFDPVPFIIDGWEKREGMHGSVIAFLVKPSESLKNLTTLLAENLNPVTLSYNHWDAFPEKKWFHVTVANGLDQPQAEMIFSAIKRSSEILSRIDRSQKNVFSHFIIWLKTSLGVKNRLIVWPGTLDETGLRITVMHGEEILAEYDLLLKKWIAGGDRHTSLSWQETLKNYRIQSGIELGSERQGVSEDIFLISDLHLGHANIIRYCSRPFLFSDPDEMDRVLIDNWNFAVSDMSTVYFLGDLRYGIHALSYEAYRRKLQGNITFIQGNHDKEYSGSLPSFMMEYHGFSFMLVHNPADAPRNFKGWVIHGHHHNNDLRLYPFINFHQRRINVSAEVIGYVPVSLRELCSIIQTQLGNGNTDPVLVKQASPE